MATTANDASSQLRTWVKSIPKKKYSVYKNMPRSITRQGRYVYNNSANTIDKIKCNSVVFVETKKGKDIINAYNGGKKSCYAIYTDPGNDIINVHGGKLVIADTGNGKDTVNVNGGVSIGVITGSGNDTVNIKGGTTVAVVTDTGNDIININGGKLVVANTGSGKDTVSIKKGSGRIITTGIGNDIINISAGSKHLIAAASGNDTINLKKGAGSNSLISADAGDDIINITGGSNNLIYSGSGKDTIKVTGGNSQKIYLGDGKNSVTTSASNTYIEQLSAKSSDTISVNWNSNVGKTIIDTIEKANGYKDELIIKGAKSSDFTFGYGVSESMLVIYENSDQSKAIAINNWYSNSAFSKITFTGDNQSLSFDQVFDKSIWV